MTGFRLTSPALCPARRWKRTHGRATKRFYEISAAGRTIGPHPPRRRENRPRGGAGREAAKEPRDGHAAAHQVRHRSDRHRRASGAHRPAAEDCASFRNWDTRRSSSSATTRRWSAIPAAAMRPGPGSPRSRSRPMRHVSRAGRQGHRSRPDRSRPQRRLVFEDVVCRDARAVPAR